MSGNDPLLWLRVNPSREVIRSHLRHLRGTFAAAGWRIHSSAEPPPSSLVESAPLAVVDDPWVEALPALAEALVRARPSTEMKPCWRIPQVNGLEGEQRWRPKNGPYTLRDYRRRALDRPTIARPMVGKPWLGFAAAPAKAAARLLGEGWPPDPEKVALVPGARLYRYDDPADHDRLELDPFIPSEAETIVDVGCGHGRLGERLRRTGGATPKRHVIGIEPDPAMAREATSRLDRVLAARGEEGLAELAPPIDCVVFADVLEHMPDPGAALRNAARLLAPDSGRIVVSMPSTSWAPVLRALAAGRWDATLAGVQARDHLVPLTLASFSDLAAECGLVVERAEPLPAPLPLGLRLWAWLAARTAGGDPRALAAPQWIVVLRTRTP